MRDFLIDTQTICYWYDIACPQHETVVANIESLRRQTESGAHQPHLLISVISLGEIEYGHRVNSPSRQSANKEYLKFLTEQLPDRLDVTEDVAPVFGEFRKRLFDQYAPGEKRRPGMRPEQLIEPIASKELGIQENDLWLCAQAAAYGMVLVTNDAMRRIREVSQGVEPPLFIQNWAVPNAAKLE